MGKHIKLRLIVMNILQWAIWGAYLTSMGNYLVQVGLGPKIGLFYAMQGIVSIFMPALMGIVADKWLGATKTLALCQFIAGAAMLGAGLYAASVESGAIAAGMKVAEMFSFPLFMSLYTVSVAFYMPTIALSNSAAYGILEQNGYDTVKDFPPIRVFGTVGFIASMWIMNFCKTSAGTSFQFTYHQFIISGVIGLVLVLYCFTLPKIKKAETQGQSLMDALGLSAFKLFRDRQMAIFFIFSMLLGVALQITNGYATPFISHFQGLPEFAESWGAKNATAIYSISQIAETLGILLIPFAMKKFGIKNVMLIAMLAWVLRFGLFGLGDTGSGVWMLILSCIVYGVAFDFFNISGSLYVNERTSGSVQNSAQGLFMLMTNGIGATVGTLSAQAIVNHFTHSETVMVNGEEMVFTMGDWSTCWYIFAGYALVVAILFFILFKAPAKDAPKLV
ncbi:MAG: MFS transporter [Bacteroidales bacterium]|nr:MFS transporter [Bacteroidales bacterium]MDY6170675.1 MFS transporter [Candidatus Cryptobacteroides sp.]